MNKLIQNLFLVVYPFYPLWAWVFVKFAHFPPDKVLVFLMIPLVLYIIWSIRVRVPAYLWCYIVFTIFHLGSVYYNELLPTNTNWFNYILSDFNVLGCALFFVIENTNFDKRFIKIMTRNILIVVGISVVVSIIQIKDPLFFYNLDNDPDMIVVGENRNASIYSWLGQNSVGVTFPILLSILLSVFDFKSKPFPFIALSGVIVPFLTRARYVMISAIIAFSQLLLVRTIPIKKKVNVILFFIIGIIAILGISQMVGYDVNKVIDERILEKDADMGSAKTRLLSYEVFLLKFPENPYFGVGPSTRADVVDLLGGEAPLIHVGFLSYLYFYGALGGGLFFLVLALILRELWLTGRNYGYWGSFYGLVGFVLANFTFVYFVLSEMGIVIALIYARYYNVNAVRLYHAQNENDEEEDGDEDEYDEEREEN